MKYRLIGSNDYITDPISVILNNRGVEDIEAFLNPDESVINHWSLLNNIDKAVDCLLWHLEKNNNLFIQVDSDCDGLTSSAILINYLNKTFPKAKIKWRLQEDKSHGVKVDTVPDGTHCVIIPDAGSNQFQEHEELKERGIDVIVLDHHLCEKESEHAIVVNNQLSPQYKNKNFSGAGIVYKFCQALDNRLNISLADEFLDLVAVGNIADMIDLRELETRYYVYKGLNQIKNSFLKALIEKQSFSMKGEVSPTTISFYIVPLINAVVRVGSLEEKLNVFKSFIESKELIYYKRNDEHEPIQINTARQLTNVKRRQDKLRDEGVALIEKRIAERGLDKNKFLIVNVTGILEPELSGLVANQLVGKYKRPVLLIRQMTDQEGMYGGSARGYDKSAIKDLRQFLLSLGTFEFCEGHANAHGIGIKADKIIETNELINEMLKDIEFGDDTYDVDFIIPAKQLDAKLVKNIAELKKHWGQGVQEPLFAIENVIIDKNNIYLNKSVLKFTYKNIEFIKFKSNEEAYQKLLSGNGNSKSFTVIGRFDLNSWNGKVTPQVVIDEYEVADNNDFIF
jgi:single-stranded-DNA-specific exonuclease